MQQKPFVGQVPPRLAGRVHNTAVSLRLSNWIWDKGLSRTGKGYDGKGVRE